MARKPYGKLPFFNIFKGGVSGAIEKGKAGKRSRPSYLRINIPLGRFMFKANKK